MDPRYFGDFPQVEGATYFNSSSCSYSAPVVSMPRRQPVSAARAESTEKGHFFDLSKDPCIPAGLPSKRDGSLSSAERPESSKQDASPPSTDRSESSHVERTHALKALESFDYLEVKAALARIASIDPQSLLDQIDKPKRPNWQTIIDDWVSVKIPRPVFEKWDTQRHEWDHIYFEYDPSTELMLIKCMPSSIHEAIPSRFIRLAEREITKLSRAAQKVVETGTTEHSGKEADGFIQITERRYPSLVIEAGWSESGKNLIEDARLWLWGTNSVEFVIVVENIEKKVLRDDMPESEEAGIEETFSDGQPIELKEQPADDDALQQAWADQLLRLHGEGNLMKPLLGSVESKLYIYRRARDGDDETKTIRKPIPTGQETIHQDIYCDFDAEIYPNVSMSETKLRWKDILGTPPEEFNTRDLNKYFRIDLQQFRDSTVRSIEKQIMDNADSRAGAILKRRSIIPHYPSHSELKRRSGPNMLDGQAADTPMCLRIRNRQLSGGRGEEMHRNS